MNTRYRANGFQITFDGWIYAYCLSPKHAAKAAELLNMEQWDEAQRHINRHA